jgi:ABC-type nitrate/sulfonate/bicarbonate transport system permease component
MIHIFNWFRVNWPPIVLLSALVIVWQLVVELAHVPEWILPSPIHIVTEIPAEWQVLNEHMTSTIFLVTMGFLLGSLIGIVVAVGMHAVPFMKKATFPLLVISQNIPIIALAPLLMIWFGFGILPKLMVIMLICFFPVTINVLDGLQQTDRTSYLYMQMIGASKTQTFYKLEFPYALPFLFSGLKISATYSVLGAVIAEWLGASKGIGVYMLLAKNSFQTDHVFLAIFLIVAIALFITGCISFVEKYLVRWNQKSV